MIDSLISISANGKQQHIRDTPKLGDIQSVEITHKIIILLKTIRSGSSPKIPTRPCEKKVIIVFWFTGSKCQMPESPELGLHLAHILHFGKKKGVLIWKLWPMEICCQDVVVDMQATHSQRNS